GDVRPRCRGDAGNRRSGARRHRSLPVGSRIAALPDPTRIDQRLCRDSTKRYGTRRGETVAGDDRSAARHLALWKALAAAPHSFDFYHALREIECAFPERPRIGEARRPQHDPVRFGQEPALNFATSSLVAFTLQAEGRPPRLAESFFGLLGPN